MANKYQTFADLLHASYSGLQALGFAFAKGKKRYDRECRSCNSSKGTKDLLAWYSERGEFPPMRVLAQVRQAKLGRTNSGRSYIVKKSTYD